MRLEATTALVTGASGGLGGVFADALAARGVDVVASGRRAAALDAVATRTGGRALVADLSSAAGVDALVKAAGSVDILVANAALPASGPLLEYQPDEIARAIDVNLRAPILLARALAPGMVERGRGHIVLVSSLSALTSTAYTSLYNATKFGLRGFGLALRQDLHGTGVGVSVIMPGFVRDTGMFATLGSTLPRIVRTSPSAVVAAALLRAIEHDRPEVLVAPLPIRIGARLGSIAPGMAARVTRAMGGDHIAAQIAERQRHQR
jgi:short-subunit dehydrogenase